MTNSPRYVPAAEQAKLVRTALKTAFGKAVKFSVTCSRGSAIEVRWTDGPTKKEVEAVTSPFRGGDFDGMNDYRQSHTSEFNGEKLYFGADFVFCYREISETFRANTAKAIELIAKDYPLAYSDLLSKAPRNMGDDLNDYQQQAGNICQIISLASPKDVDNLPKIIATN